MNTTFGDKARAGVAAIDLETETVSVGSSNRANLAAVEYGSGKPLPWNPAPDKAVNAMVYQDGRLFVGGEFTQVGTNAVPYLAVFAEEGGSWLGEGNVVGSEFQAKLFGEEGKTYIIEASTDLGAWQEILRGQPVNGSIPFSDPIGTSGKFYRSRLQQ